MAKKDSKLEQALAVDRQGVYLRNDQRPSSPSIARSYKQSAIDRMKVEPETLEVESGELMHNPDDLQATYCNPLSEWPDQAAVEASLARTDMLGRINCSGLGLDTANSIGAANSMERMLAHQMAACHKTALDLMQEAYSLDCKYRLDPNTSSVIQARKLNSANRLMQTYQQAMVTLSKVRSGGKQTMVVQHVQVNEGGQAIVAGGDTGRGNSENE
ncbi:MAG: hypothetical protein R8K20_09525 [Gallionellaceae bacterium]